MKVLIGLGNPGPTYERSRHNAGWLVAEAVRVALGLPEFSLKKKLQAAASVGAGIVIAQPQTYMNRSGEAVYSLLKYYGDVGQAEYPDLAIMYDDLDIPLGSYKFQYAKSPKVHNGIASVQDQLKTDSFWHARVGIDNREGKRLLPGQAYVLQPFTNAEKVKLQLVIEELTQKLIDWVNA